MTPPPIRTDPRFIRKVLAYSETHGIVATCRDLGTDHSNVYRWRQYRAQSDPSWPTDADVATWDEKAPQRRRNAARKARYAKLRYLNGGRPLGTLIDATGTARRIRALMAIGWSQSQIGVHLGVSGVRVSQWAVQIRPTIRRDTADRIADVYDRLSMTRPDGKAAALARAYAKRRGWAPPLAWDDDTIDDPNARPAGLPQTRPVAAGIDQVAIERRMLGDRSVQLHAGESAELVRRMIRDGWSQRGIAEHTGVNAHRYITRDEAAA